jgi:hypothetical protein
MSVHAHWVYLGALFSALVQSTLGLTMIARVAWNISKDPHGLKCGVTIYRLVVLMSAIFIFVRATPTALVILFDPPYPLTKSLDCSDVRLHCRSCEEAAGTHVEGKRCRIQSPHFTGDKAGAADYRVLLGVGVLDRHE